MDSQEHPTADEGSPPPPVPDSKDSPPADSPPPSPKSPPTPSPPSKDSPPSSSPPAPSPPSPSPPPPSPSPPSPSPPSPSPPPPTQSPPSTQQIKGLSPPPPPSQTSSGSTPPPSPPSNDSPPEKDSPPPSPPSPPSSSTSPSSPSPPSPTDGSTTPPGPPPATPETPPPSTESPPSADLSPPGTAIPPPSTTTPPHEGVAGSPPAPLGSSSPPHESSGTTSPSGSQSTSAVPSPPTTASSSSSVNTPVIVGVVAGAAALLAFIIICLVCSKKKKRKQHDQYYNRAGSQYNQQNLDHVVKFPSPSLSRPTGTPTGATAAIGGVGWGTNNDSSNYSGQHNQHQNMQTQSPLGNIGGYASQSQFSYQELAAATSGFSQENLLGQGGFGYVHKGVLANGTVVAVKSLKTGSGQGEREFQAEVEIISRVHHRHLVSLVGYCIAESQRMLVYEFVPNKTLEHHLHGKDVPVMDWASRMRIALGSAKGLAYLHEDCHPRIIHRDIKAANILLDENYEAMVADFGLAKLSSDNFTHVSTRVMGTFGYLAPEYASSGKLSDKSDVFSFGVMLLELVTGQRPVDPTGQMEDSLVDWSRPLMTKALEDGNYDEIADPRMEGNFVPYEMAHMIACASASVRHSAKRRPRMSQIVRSLEGDLAIEDMNVGVKNALSNTTSGISTTSGPDSIYDTGAYNADMMKFRKMVMNPQETRAITDDFGETTEHGLDPNSPVSGEYMHKK